MSNSNTNSQVFNPKDCEDQEIKEKKLYIPDYLAQALCEQTSQPSKKKKSAFFGGDSSNCHVETLRTLCVQNLPEWTTEYDLKTLLSRSSSVALEFSLKTGATPDTNRFIKHIDIVRNNDTGNCVGYAYVEFFDHTSASELLKTLSETNVYFPGSNKLLAAGWSKNNFKPLSLLDSYDYYIGNLRSGVTEKCVFNALKSIHSGIASVRLLPQEILGCAPTYVSNTKLSACQDKTNEKNLCVFNAFYHLEGSGKEKNKQFLSQNVNKCEESGDTPCSKDQRWSCGFVRLQEKFVPESKTILDCLQKGLKMEAANILCRNVMLSVQSSCMKECKYVRTGILLISLSSKFGDDTTNANRGSASSLKTDLHSRSGGDSKRAKLITHIPSIEYQKFLFVSNLCEDENEETLGSLFSPFGHIVSLRIINLKRVAFVELSDHRCAQAALCHLSGCWYRGLKLYVTWGRNGGLALKSITKPSVESNTAKQSSFVLQEKSYGASLLQAMQPQYQAPEISVIENDELDDINKRKLYLASLYAALPQ
ncbi:uncharacterized protein LOC128883035 [Hylaeus volcanicus]|uniref:uncharacterized protein LOC128883035 n=1 Tax=Hylaeus volcanicus TaxID=313075 RepID=UPI0023B7FAE8|nr:uncharacterized protein LOC128883035 [Hylaeus volcanicus]